MSHAPRISVVAPIFNEEENIGGFIAELTPILDRLDPHFEIIAIDDGSTEANRMISDTTGVVLHDYGCSLKAIRSDGAKNIRLYGEMHRFIPAVASWMGVKVTELKVNHRPRVAGSSKYGIDRTVRVILDLITVKFLLSYSTSPIQIFGLLGLISGGLGFLLGVWLTIQKFVFEMPLGNRPALLLSALLVLVGVQFISIGLIAEMLARTYHESQGKPIYVIRDTLD
ncbi:MAG: glycosyltransferase [Nitrospinae bacterium]|nr:glycosyltransferase [Nitrospinota bacterium]